MATTLKYLILLKERSPRERYRASLSRTLMVCECNQHVLGAATVMSITLGQLESDRQTGSIDQRMDFGCHATFSAKAGQSHTTQNPLDQNWTFSSQRDGD